MEDFNTKEVNVPPVPKGDDFVIGEGFKLDETVLEDEPKPAVKRGKKRKKTGVGSALLRIGIIVFTSLFLAFVIILFGAEYLGIGIGRGQEVVVEIEKGSSTRAIAEELKEVNAINSTLMFRVYSKLMGYDGEYQYGVYSFKNELGYSELTELLRTEGAVAESVRVTIPERASVDDIIELLVEKGVCTKSDFINAMDSDRYNYDFVKELPTEQVYYRFEGYLFPDTYDFYCYDNS
ncbi:MAG: endolytic transglycosylase MltG, partial [Acutalibacteraceae bacterium]|nr:endolytic transglycosylase MltG [Acutalibacteraceae bacterium]